VIFWWEQIDVDLLFLPTKREYSVTKVFANYRLFHHNFVVIILVLLNLGKVNSVTNLAKQGFHTHTQCNLTLAQYTIVLIFA